MLPRQCFAALVVLDSREKAEDLAAEVPHIADAEHRARPAARRRSVRGSGLCHTSGSAPTTSVVVCISFTEPWWTVFDLPSGVDVLESSDLQPTAEMRLDYSDTTRALWAKS